MASPPDRLDSWKEIAAHVRRTVRTVQRWESACGLPVHRHGHRQSSSVYAFRSELDAWWLSRKDPDVVLQEGRARPPPGRPSTHASARDLSLMARAQWNARTVDGIRRSVALATQATERDPDCAPAYGMLALAYAVLASYTPEPVNRPMERARQAARRALELDPSVTDAHTALGLVHLSYDWRWADAERAFLNATRLAPQDATAWSWFGFWHLSRGHEEQALVETRRAERLDPASLIIQTQVGWILYFTRRYAEALDQLGRTLTCDPHFWRTYLNFAWCYMATGRNEDGVHALETTVALNDYPLLRTVLARAYARAGREREARAMIAQIGSADRYFSAYYLAQAWAALGHLDEAGRLLLKACDDREWHLIFLRSDPGIDDLRGHPAYRAVVDRMNF